jgi:hypothetical protein
MQTATCLDDDPGGGEIGVTSFQAGALVDSSAPGAPLAEVCDGKDNDCGGAIDAVDSDLVRSRGRSSRACAPAP